MRYIIADPEVCHGKPIFKGTRILVSDIIELLAAGMPVERILEEYPRLNRGMIRDSLGYAAEVIRGKHYVRFKVPAR
jgi:uncharacterized protein (DUF433 family)